MLIVFNIFTTNFLKYYSLYTQPRDFFTYTILAQSISMFHWNILERNVCVWKRCRLSPIIRELLYTLWKIFKKNLNWRVPKKVFEILEKFDQYVRLWELVCLSKLVESLIVFNFSFLFEFISVWNALENLDIETKHCQMFVIENCAAPIWQVFFVFFVSVYFVFYFAMDDVFVVNVATKIATIILFFNFF
jgi:hypothetical protein